MARPVSDLQAMLAGMEPVCLDDGGWVFVHEDGEELTEPPFAIIHEGEGVTVIRQAAPTDESPVFARITLQVHSDLEGVGLTAAVSAALAKAGIACNVVAGLHHDYIFVPQVRQLQALEILDQLSQVARR